MNSSTAKNQMQVKNGIVRNIKSLFEDTQHLKDTMYSKDSDWNETQVNEMLTNLLRSISDIEQRINNDLHFHSQKSIVLSESYQNMEHKIMDMNDVIKQIQSKSNHDTYEIKKDLSNISSLVSPLQSTVMGTLNESIEELKELRKDLIKTGNHLLIQESLDALSEYINISQKQLFKVLAYHNEKLNNVDKNLEKSLEEIEEQLKTSENKLVNYLSFVYQSMNSKSNHHSIDIGIIAKIDEINKKLDNNTGESKRYLTTIYNKLNEPREKEQSV
ncbi:hypothetical protein [Salinibacillus xinjiangensis]|nr:hypothetical protein [Salinibacillus xinjiangensis]